jgi:hypothetical protein
MADQTGNYLVNDLQLVYTPISNQEGEWLKKDEGARSQISRSKLYMIGSRPEVLFVEPWEDKADRSLRVDLAMNGAEDRVHARLGLDELVGEYEGSVELEFGPKLIRLWSVVDGKPHDLLDWFTVDKLMYEASHGMPGVEAPALPESFRTFDLLYVGISKATDSFQRLFDTGHHARVKILSNEHQRHATARVTDEMTLFFFDIEPLAIRVSDITAPADDFGADIRPDQATLVADAEKAFVSFLDPSYNAEKYAQYPRGKDGLYSAGFRRYLYSVAEDLTFRTASTVLHGGVDESRRDVILVEGDAVTMHSLGASGGPR